MTNNGMVQMVGYNYMVDVANRAVFRNDGRPIKMVKENHGSRYYLTRHDGKRKSICANRVMYAAMIGINPDTIPKDIYVVERDGELKLMYHKDMNDENHKKARENHIQKWRNIMTQRMVELQLLMDYYDTGDASPVVKYVLDRNDRLASWITDHFHCSRQTSHDVASEVIEDVCRRAVNRNLYTSSISTALRGYARNAMKKRRQTVAYDE